MTSDNSLSLILRRLDEIERKLDDMEELRNHGHPPPMAAKDKCLAQSSRSQGRRAMGGN
jgi:hypothetical protein